MLVAVTNQCGRFGKAQVCIMNLAFNLLDGHAPLLAKVVAKIGKVSARTPRLMAIFHERGGTETGTGVGPPRRTPASRLASSPETEARPRKNDSARPAMADGRHDGIRSRSPRGRQGRAGPISRHSPRVGRRPPRPPSPRPPR